MISQTSVELLIGAKNTASPVLKKAANDQKQYEKELGNTADTSARSTAALAIMLQVIGSGGGKVAEFVSQLALFKGSLDSLRAAQAENSSKLEKGIALAGLFVSAFSVGYKIGEFFSTGTEAAKKLNEEIERSRKLAGDLTSSMQREQESEKFKISLIDDPERQLQELRDLRERAERELSGAVKTRNNAKGSFDEYNTWENNWLRINKSIQIAEKERYETAEKRVDAYKSSLQSLTTQINQLELTEEARRKKERKSNFEKQQKEKQEALKKEMEQRKEAAKAAEQQQKTDESYINGLKQQLILLRSGKEAAEAFRASQSGISQAAQDEGAKYRQQIDLLTKRNELQAKAKSIIEANLTPLQRFRRDYESLAKIKLKGLIGEDTFRAELKRLKDRLSPTEKGGGQSQFVANTQDSSRFLSRARGTDPIAQTNENTKKAAELLADANRIFDNVNKNLTAIKANTAQPENLLT